MLGGGDQVGLVGAEVVQHGSQDRSFAEPLSQVVAGQAGEREQPVGPVVVAEHPDERAQRERLGVCRG